MWKSLTKLLALRGLRYVSLIPHFQFKVAVLGAAGNIGQPLSLLLKLNPLIHELSLYDIRNTPGVAADLSHIDNHCVSLGFTCPDQLGEALRCADIVTICAGMPRLPDQTRDDLFATNAKIIKELLDAICINCPSALIAIITNPVNSLVPFAACILTKAGIYDPRRLFGVTTLDVVRSRTFLGHLLCVNPEDVCVPVIGGHSSMSIIPVLSQSHPKFKASQEEIETLTKRIQDAGNEIIMAKNGAGCASLSMAYAAAYFITSLLRGLNGDEEVIECSYVDSCETEATFFATPLLLGKDGVEQNMGTGPLSGFETRMLECAVEEIKKDIEKGLDCASHF